MFAGKKERETPPSSRLTPCLFRGSEVGGVGFDDVAVIGPGSREVRLLLSVLYPRSVVRYWFARPLRPSVGKPRWGLEVFRFAVFLPSSSEGSSAPKLGASSEPPHRCDCTGPDPTPFDPGTGVRRRRITGTERVPTGTGRPTAAPRRVAGGRPASEEASHRSGARCIAEPKLRLQRLSASPPVHRAAPLLSFRSPTAPSAAGVLFTSSGADESASRDGHGDAASATFPPSGFLTLLAACSAHRLAGLFHPTSAHGVTALQSFLLSRSMSRLPAALAFLVLQPRPGRAAHLQGLAPRESSLPACRVSTATAEPDALLGFLPSRALRSRRGASKGASSHPTALSEEGAIVRAGRCDRSRTTDALGFAGLPSHEPKLARSRPTATRQSLSEREGWSFSLETNRPSWGFRPPSSLPEGSSDRLGQGQSH
jgi:hypothetical protein